MGTIAKVTAAPTLDTNAYASGDCLHTAVITFTGVASQVGGTGTITKLIVIDAAVQSAAGELWLFDTTVTPAAANAAHAITDAEALTCVGVIPFGPYYASSANSVSVNGTVRLTFKAAAADASLYGILVTRGTPTYAAGSLTVAFIVSQD